MSAGFFSGASYVVAGLRLLAKPRVRMFVVIPLLINTALFSVALVWGMHYLDALMERWLPGWASWLEWLLWPVLGILALALIFFLFTVVANLIAAPFNGYLAQAVEEHLGGTVPDLEFQLRRLPADILTALGSELRKILFFGLCSLPFLMLFLVPVINLIAPFAWFLFGAWALSHEYADYPMGNHNLHFVEQRKILAAKKPLIIGFGIGVMALTLIPIVNFLAVPAAVCGATVMWVRVFRAEYATPQL